MRFAFTFVLALTFLPGCGSTPAGPAIAKVSGVVTLDGQPVEGATITFNPKEGPSSFGITDPAGKFFLKTGSGRDGAAVGDHKIAVILSMTAGGTAPDAKPDDLAPLMASEIGTTGAAPKAIGPRTVWLVPEKYSKPETSGLTATVPSGGLSDHKLELTKK